MAVATSPSKARLPVAKPRLKSPVRPLRPLRDTERKSPVGLGIE